jgi:hypothetical protein
LIILIILGEEYKLRSLAGVYAYFICRSFNLGSYTREEWGSTAEFFTFSLSLSLSLYIYIYIYIYILTYVSSNF